MLPDRQLQSYIGFAIRAGKVVWGADNCLRSKHLYAVLAVDTINRTSRNELERLCDGRRVPLVWCDEELLTACVHKQNCKCIGLTDPNLAQAAVNNIIAKK